MERHVVVGGKEHADARRSRATRLYAARAHVSSRGSGITYLDFFPFYLTVDSDAHAENLNFCILTCPNFAWRIGV